MRKLIVLCHLIRKEILEQILSFRFLILSVLGGLTIWWSLFSGFAYYLESLREYRLAQITTEERIRELLVAHEWNEVTGQSYEVHKPPVSLSIFVCGLEPTFGRSIQVSGFGGSLLRLRLSQTEVEPILGVSPSLDLGLVVQIVFSLFILLMTYDAICGEKEAGTLRLIASFPVPRQQVLLAKFIGTLVPILLAFTLPVLLAVFVLLLVPEVWFTPSEWVRLSCMIGAFWIYLTAFACVGLLTSSLTYRTSTAFVIVLIFWVLSVTIIPRLSLIIADALRPAPSRHQYQVKKAAISTALYGIRLEQGKQWEHEYLKSTGQEWLKTPEGRENRYREVIRSRQEAEKDAQAEFKYIDETFKNYYSVRQDLAVVLVRFSPAFALKQIMIQLAGTGTSRQQRFMDKFSIYEEQYRWWWIRTKDRDRLREAHPAKYGEYKWEISDMPRFVYQENWPEEDLEAVLVDVGILVLWAVVCFLGANMALLRYDLR